MRHLTTRLGVILAAAILIPACGGGRRSSTGSASPAGILNFLTRGGVATNGAGGKGGNVNITAKTGSDIQVSRASLSAPGIPAPRAIPLLSDHPRHITASTVYTVSAGAHTTTNLTFGDTGLVADDATFPATDLIIDAGVTVTFPANDVTPNAVALSLTGFNTIQINGTLVVGQKVPTPNDGADLTLGAETIVVGPAGTINASGLDNAAGNGGNGGSLTLTADLGGLLEGVVLSSGGAGTTQGGIGGNVGVTSQTGSLYCLGSIVNSGGSASAGLGGDAGGLTLQSSVVNPSDGGLYLSGSIVGAGGPGTTQGGKGALTALQAMSLGGVLSLAKINVSGGASTGGNGGFAGGITISAKGEAVQLFGSILGKGGVAAGGTNVGGNGSALSITTVNAPTIFAVGQSSGPIEIGCAVDVRGGDGPVGGIGGAVTISSNSNTTVNAAEPGLDPILIGGYALFDLSGGDGTTTGGNAGLAVIKNNAAADLAGAQHIGSSQNDVDWTAKGGNSSAGGGGSGGRFALLTEDGTANINAPSFTRSVVNSGNIDCSGGDGATTGGTTFSHSSDAIFLYDHIACSNFGTLKATGGKGGTGDGGTPGTFNVQLISEGPVLNQGNIDVSGGASVSGNGGNSSNVGFFGASVTTTGNIFCKGGSSSTGNGGAGSLLSLTSFAGGVTVHGMLSVAGGAGATAGAVGTIIVGGIAEQPGPDGSITF